MFYASRPVRGISFGGLWRHSEFVKLWAGHTISRFGREVSQLAIPLTAALALVEGNSKSMPATTTVGPAPLWIVFSPVRALREQPASA